MEGVHVWEAGPGVWGWKSPSGVQGQSPGSGSGDFVPQKLKQNVKKKFFCVQTHAQFKKIRILNGVEPPNHHSGHASVFYLVQTTGDPGEQLR